MAEYLLPPSLIANESEWLPVDFSAVQSSVLSGAARTVSRGQRWSARLTFRNLKGDDANLLAALLAQLRGKANRLWIAHPAYVQQGSFPAGEMLSNGGFLNGSTGWSAGGTSSLAVYNRTLRCTTGGTGSGQGFSQSVAFVNGAAYALRSLLIDGPTTASLTLGVSLAVGTTYSALSGARGLISAAGLASSSSSAAQFPLSISTGGGLAAGMFVLCTYASMRRCALVVNPGATIYLSTLPCDALPSSTQGLLRAGDRFEVNGEYKICTADLNSDSGGAGTLMFEPALRKVVPDNTPIHIGEPLLRGMLTSDPSMPVRPGVRADFDFSLSEQ